MSRRCLPYAALVALFALVSACGSSPASPSTSLSLSGTWTGSFQYQTGGVTVTDAVSLVLQQPSATATGSWSASGLTSGTVSFAAGATFAGTMTISQPNIGSGPCNGSSTIAGTATTTDLTFTVADLTTTASCPWATQMKFVLKK